ncbi:MAG: hypothetical protein K0S61_717 [Anaerocolumna sp.]|jgi:hypothetical protein|nr:hypothetical protein [Anaerocolumna sp.]
MKQANLVGLIKKLAKKEGHDNADSIICGMMLIHKDYFSLKKAIEEYLRSEEQ